MIKDFICIQCIRCTPSVQNNLNIFHTKKNLLQFRVSSFYYTYHLYTKYTVHTMYTLYAKIKSRQFYILIICIPSIPRIQCTHRMQKYKHNLNLSKFFLYNLISSYIFLNLYIIYKSYLRLKIQKSRLLGELQVRFTLKLL